MDDRIPAKLAGSFAATTGLEQEDLLQEARMAIHEAEAHYDPHRAAWSTFSYACVTRHLCGVATHHRLRHPQHEELGDWMPSTDPSPEDCAIFAEMLRQLPDDARTVVALVLSDASALAGMTPTAVRRAVRSALRWPADRTNDAVHAITKMLRGPMVRKT